MIIGRTYLASDNSYLLNLTNPEKDFRLAGTHKYNEEGTGFVKDNPRIPAMIVSEPYECMVEFLGKFHLRTFVNVQHGDYTIRVLFDKRNVL